MTQAQLNTNTVITIDYMIKYTNTIYPKRLVIALLLKVDKKD